MNCQQARQAWHRRWDDDVVDPSADEHFRSCQPCRAYHAQMDALAGALDELREETESMVSRRGAVQTPAAGRSWSSMLRPLTRIAAVLALVLTAGLYFSWQQVGNEPMGFSPLAGNMNVSDDSDDFVIVASTVKDVTEITLQGESANRYLAVATPTSQPGVKLFWLYPTVGEQRPKD